MANLEIGDLRASVRWEGVERRNAVGVARVAGDGGDDEGVEEGEEAGLRQVVVVGVPVQPDPAGADLRAALFDVADDEDLMMVLQAVVPLGVQIGASAEAAGEAEVVGGVQWVLIREEQNDALGAGGA